MPNLFTAHGIVSLCGSVIANRFEVEAIEKGVDECVRHESLPRRLLLGELRAIGGWDFATPAHSYLG